MRTLAPGATAACRSLRRILSGHRKADALFRCLEDDEGRGLAGAQLPHQFLVHDHFGDAAVGQAAHEAGAADVGLVDLEPSPDGNSTPSGATTRISRLFCRRS